MKKWKIYTSLLIVLLLAGSAIFFSHLHKVASFKKNKEITYPLPQENKRFVVVIPSYNNSLYCEDNIRSVLNQDYHDFRVIYIDDCSTDDTAEKVQRHVDLCFPNAPIKIIKNTKRQGALANFYYAVHSCQDDEIIVVVDGDDKLANTHVLSKLNSVYANPEIWLTYGDFIDHPAYTARHLLCKKFPKHVIRNNTFRSHPWVSSHLRTFYAGLFKKIKLKDLLMDGSFFPMAGDLAVMFPMLEMAGEHHKYIRNTLYIYNCENPINDNKVSAQLQLKCNHKISKLPKYKPLKSLTSTQLAMPADLIIFSYDRPLQLYALLESAHRYLTHVANFSVIYRTSSSDYDTSYLDVIQAFPGVNFIKQSSIKDFKPLLMDVLSNTNANHVIFAVDDMIVIDHLDVALAVHDLEKTGAYGLYLAHGKEINYCYMEDRYTGVPPSIEADKNLHIWQFKQGSGDWAYPNSLDMVLYRKQDIIKCFSKLNFTNPNTLEGIWHTQAKLEKMGLYYTTPKAVNIPLNLVNISSNRYLNTISAQELLLRFQEGYKIDISPLFQIPHHARHMEYNPQFVLR